MLHNSYNDRELISAFDIEEAMLNNSITDLSKEFDITDLPNTVEANLNKIDAVITPESKYIAKIFLTTVIFTYYLFNENKKADFSPSLGFEKFFNLYDEYKNDFVQNAFFQDEIKLNLKAKPGAIKIHAVPLVKAMLLIDASSIDADYFVGSRYRLCFNCFYLIYKTDPGKPSKITYRHLKSLEKFFLNGSIMQALCSSDIAFDTFLKIIQGYTYNRHLSITADLTEKLLNRKGFIDNFMQMCSSYNNLALVAIDLDYFKQFNDSEGHDAGDQVLRGASEVFRNVADEFDGVIARTGGEEFLGVFPINDTQAGHKSLEEFAKRINSQKGLHKIPRKRRLKDCKRKYREHLSASIGLGILRNCFQLHEWFEKEKKDKESNRKMIDGIFAIVDSALYSVKKGAKGKRFPSKEQDGIKRKCRNGYSICEESELDDFVQKFMLPNE